MKKILLRTLGILISVSISISLPATAQDVTGTEISQDFYEDQTGPVTYTLSLEDAISLAMTENPQLIANDYTQNANKININTAKSNRNSVKKSMASVPLAYSSATTIEQLCARNGYYVTAAQVQYDLSVLEEDRIIASVSYNTTSAYYNVVLMDMLVKAAKDSYDLALKNKIVVDAQYNQGLISQIAYDNASIAVDGARCELEAYELNRDIAMRNLKNQLNIKPDSTVILTDTIETQEFTSDVEADVKAAMESRYDLTGAKKTLELSVEYLDISDAFTISSAVYNTAYADYVTKEYQYKTACEGVELAIRNEYNTIITNHSSMEIAGRTYNMKLSEYDAAKVQYDLGLITNLELTDKINELYKSQIAYSQAKLNFRMAVEKYKYDITIGLPQ